MAHFYTVNLKLPNSEISKSESWIKYGTEVTLILSSTVVGNSNNETNFPHKLLLTNTQVSGLHKAFANGLAADIKSLKSQLAKMVQSGGFLNPFFESVFESNRDFACRKN